MQAIHSSPAKIATPRGGQPRWLKYLIWACYVVIGLSFSGFAWFVIAKPVQVVPRSNPAPPFMLRDANGAWLTDGELRGKIVLLQVAYQGCTTECVITTELFRELQQRIIANQAALPIQLITVGLDGDDPHTLTALQKELAADGTNWRVLSASPESVRELVGGELNIYYAQRDGATYLRDQTAVMIDTQGMFRLAYQGNQLSPDYILRHVELMQQEVAATGWSRGIYEAAHLFTCYAN